MKRTFTTLSLLLMASTVFASPKADFFLFNQAPISERKLNRVRDAIRAVGVDPSGMEFEVGPSVWGDYDTPTYYGSNGTIACQLKTIGKDSVKCVTKSK